VIRERHDYGEGEGYKKLVRGGVRVGERELTEKDIKARAEVQASLNREIEAENQGNTDSILAKIPVWDRIYIYYNALLYDIDPALLVSIGMSESAWGTANPKYYMYKMSYSVGNGGPTGDYYGLGKQLRGP
jgi:hypothetical protein